MYSFAHIAFSTEGPVFLVDYFFLIVPIVETLTWHTLFISSLRGRILVRRATLNTSFEGLLRE